MLFIYFKIHDFSYFPFLDRDVPRSPSYDVYIFSAYSFVRVCFNVSDVNNRHPFWLSEFVDIIIKKHGNRYILKRKSFATV